MNNSKDGLYEKLNTYSDGDVYPFHMPGHKRNMPRIKSAYDYDITEIDGFDNLHHARGILRESMDMAAGFYGTKKTYYLVNGSTCGLLSAISAATEYGDKIIMARNCHKAVYNAVYLNNLKAAYVYPRPVEDTSILGGIHPKDVEKAIEENPDAKAVVITSPTYEGVVSYVQAIVKVVHEKGIPLIVDEAHGAHFSMSGYFPKSALECGADMVIQSVHKTLPSLTQTALLHICGDLVDESKVERYLSIYQSSSPSYVLLASIDNCVRDIMDKGPLGFIEYESNLIEFREKMSKLTQLKLIDKKILGKAGCYDLDIGKLVIQVKSITYTGQDLYNELLSKYHIQLEMAARDYVIAMTSLNDTKDGFDRLYEALFNIDRDIRIKEGYGQAEGLMHIKPLEELGGASILEKPAVTCMDIREAINSKKEEVEFSSSSGRIATEYVYLYPPGVPVIVPGQMIEKVVIDYLLDCKAKGLQVQGQEDDELINIVVIKENWKEFSYGKNILPDGEKLIGEGYHV